MKIAKHVRENVADWHREKGMKHYENGQRDRYRYDKDELAIYRRHIRIADRLVTANVPRGEAAHV